MMIGNGSSMNFFIATEIADDCRDFPNCDFRKGRFGMICMQQLI